jgi:hypothetical protein
MNWFLVGADELRMMERRNATGPRVEFGRPLAATIMGIDGTWKRDCEVHDISTDGAKLMVERGLEGLKIVEFFLLFPGNGLTYRRCVMRWCKGTAYGVRFIKNSAKKRQGAIQSEGRGVQPDLVKV